MVFEFPPSPRALPPGKHLMLLFEFGLFPWARSTPSLFASTPSGHGSASLSWTSHTLSLLPLHIRTSIVQHSLNLVCTPHFCSWARSTPLLRRPVLPCTFWHISASLSWALPSHLLCFPFVLQFSGLLICASLCSLCSPSLLCL